MATNVWKNRKSQTRAKHYQSTSRHIRNKNLLQRRFEIMVSLIKEVVLIIGKVFEALLTIAILLPIMAVTFIVVYFYTITYNIIYNEDNS